MNKKNLITLAVVLVVGYLLWNMSNKQQLTQQQQCTASGGTYDASNSPACTPASSRRYRG